MTNQVLLINPTLFFQMLNIALDGCRDHGEDAAVERLVEKLGELFDPDDPGQIVISQGAPLIIDNEGQEDKRYAWAVIEERALSTRRNDEC
jgi:hypothetical protein